MGFMCFGVSLSLPNAAKSLPLALSLDEHDRYIGLLERQDENRNGYEKNKPPIRYRITLAYS